MTSDKQILVVGHRNANESDRVIRELRRRDFEVVRLNTGAGEAMASLRLTSGRTLTAHAECDGRSINPARLGAAWLHQGPPLDPRVGADLTSAAAQSSRLRLWEGFFSLIPKHQWITTPWNLHRASNKIVQYHQAAVAGLPVPTTLISNEPECVRGFGTRPLMKYLGDSNVLWSASETGYSATTVEVALDGVEDDTIVAEAAIYQELVRSAREVRVVALLGSDGDVAACLACSVERAAGTIDVRLQEGGMATYKPYELPSAVTQALGCMLRALEVGYCSADFLVADDGSHVFLDLNVTGAWWWIDDILDGAVVTAFADALAERLEI